MKRLLVMLVLLPALAWSAGDGFPTAEQEARYRSLSGQLRCLVCQGQSIADSNADLADDLKREVRRMILAGKTDAEIVDFMVARYGDFVLFKPPVKGSTYLLWFGPLLLLISGFAVWFTLLRRPAVAAGGRLSDAERERLARALARRNPRRDA